MEQDHLMGWPPLGLGLQRWTNSLQRDATFLATLQRWTFLTLQKCVAKLGPGKQHLPRLRDLHPQSKGLSDRRYPCIIKFCMKITFIHAITATQMRLREWLQNRMGSSCPPFARGATFCPMGTLSLCTLRSEMIFDRTFLRDRSCPTTLLTLQKFWSTLLQRCATLLQRCYRSSSVALPSPSHHCCNWSWTAWSSVMIHDIVCHPWRHRCILFFILIILKKIFSSEIYAVAASASRSVAVTS